MPKSNALVNKSISACISAIEIYNKPDFKYREEIFTILLINSWELLFKAKIKKDLGKRKLYAYSLIIKKDGTKSQKKTIKRNRSGNALTIDIKKCLELVSSLDKEINKAFKDNIELLIEIRDNAIHYMNNDLEIEKLVLELGTASLKNYLNIIKEWFKIDLSKYNFYLMPISFFHGFEMINSSSINNQGTQLKNLKMYFEKKIKKTTSSPENKYNLVLNIETKFVKSAIAGQVSVTTLKNKSQSENPENVQEIVITEEDKSKAFPFTFTALKTKLRTRYNNFSQTTEFYTHLAVVKQNSQLTYERILNPHNPNSQKTYLYSPAVLEYFDKIYTKK